LAESDGLSAAISDLFRHISRLSSAAPPSTAADQASSAPSHGTTPAMALLFERVLMPRARLFYAVQQRRTQQAFGSFDSSFEFECVYLSVLSLDNRTNRIVEHLLLHGFF
jgi:hypothetical protein